MVDYDPQERELVKQLDKRLIPFFALLLLCFLMDRATLFLKFQIQYELHLQSHEWIGSFVGFALGILLGTLPITVVFRKWGPSYVLGISLFHHL
jgi:hypothetical protein